MRYRNGGCAGAVRWLPRLLGCALVAWACAGIRCDGQPACNGPIAQLPLDARIAAAEAALRASDGHDYSEITELFRECYGDEEATTYICTQFIDAPHCFRITEVSIQGENTEPQWRDLFCESERQAWESSAWGDGMTSEQITQAAGEYYDECMAGLPFLAR